MGDCFIEIDGHANLTSQLVHSLDMIHCNMSYYAMVPGFGGGGGGGAGGPSGSPDELLPDEL